MNELIMKNDKFGELEIYVDENGKVWFPATEVAEMLGYKNPRDAIAKHCKKSGKLAVSRITTEGNQYKKIYIDEGNVIRLLTKSHIPGAEEFESWIFDEVVPSVIKKGMYATEELLDNPDLFIQILTDLKNTREEKKFLENKVIEDKPKVLFADSVSTSKTTILVRELAVILNQNGIDIGEKRLFEWLRNNGYLVKDKKRSDYNTPTQKSMNLGLFDFKETAITHSDGRIEVKKTPKVTGKGQQYFVNKFLVG